MMNWWHLYAGIFTMALVLALILTPLCQKIAFATGFLDVPKKQAHKGHQKATPLLGGLAMFGAWIITILAGYLSSNHIDTAHIDSSLSSNIVNIPVAGGQLVVICICALSAVLLGLYDDRKALSALAKLAGQIVIAVAAVSFGDLKISLFISNPVFVWCISVFWFLFIMNSINFFDNMDGLAAGTAAIALSLFTIAAAANHQYFVAALGASAAGATIGFWFFNHSPAKIFMGDSGSHFLGFLLGVISVKITYFTPDHSTTHFPVLIPLFILAIPIFDTAAVVAIRLWNGKPIYIGDHNHLSHRFLHMGMSRKHAVLMVHLLALIIGIGSLPLLWGDERTSIVFLIQACIILLMITLLQWKVIKSTHEGQPQIEEKSRENKPRE